MTRQTDLLSYNENADNKPYKFVVVGSGGSGLNKYRLKHAPDGWKDEITYERNAKYKGLSRTYASNELKFPKDGRGHIQSIYEANGISAQAQLYIYKWDNQNFEYIIHFIGKIDFSTYKVDELFVSVQVLDNSFTERVKNRENVEVNLLDNTTIDGATMPVFAAANKTFAFPEQLLSAQTNWDSISYIITRNNNTDNPVEETLLVSMGYSQIDGAATQIAGTKAPSWDYFFDGDSSNIEVQLYCKVTGRIKVTTGSGGAWAFNVIAKGDDNLPVSGTGLIGATINGTDGEEKEFNLEATIAWFTLTANRKMRLDFYVSVGSWAATNSIVLEIDTMEFLMLKEVTDLSALQVTGLPYYEAFLRTIQKITNQSDCFYSDFFGRTDSEIITYLSDGQLGHMTKGGLMRGLDDYFDVNFSVKLEDLFASLSALFNLGLGVEDFSGRKRVRVERLSYFFDDAVILDLSARISESEIGKEVLPEWHYAQIKCGFKKYEYELKSAIFEYNCKQTYATVIDSLSSANNTLDIIAPYRADTNGIVVSREAHLDTIDRGKNGEDIKGDDDIFLVDTVRDSLIGCNFRARTDEDFILLSGNIDSDQYYNYFYTPKRCMLRHGMNIRAGLEKSLNTYLKFQAVDKTVSLSTQLTAEASAVIEGTDERINDLTEPLWWPEAYTIECPLYTADIILINASPYGLIKLADEKYGWILEIKTNENDKAQIKLLRANLDYVTPT